MVCRRSVSGLSVDLHGEDDGGTPDQLLPGFKLNLVSFNSVTSLFFKRTLGIVQERPVRGLFVSDAEPSLIDYIRLTKLLIHRATFQFLAPMIIRAPITVCPSVNKRSGSSNCHRW